MSWNMKKVQSRMIEIRPYDPQDVLKVCTILWHDENDVNSEFMQARLNQFDLNLIKYLDIQNAVFGLLPVFQELLKAIFFDGLSNRQISKKLNFSERNISEYSKIVISHVCLMANTKQQRVVMEKANGLRAQVKSGIWKDLEGSLRGSLGNPERHQLIEIELGESSRLVLVTEKDVNIL